MTAHDPYVRRIRAVYPELDIQHLRRDESGQYNVVLIADEAIVFRFPRFVEGVERLRGETVLLEAIGPYVSLPIPEPRFVSFDPPVPGEVFAGYRMLAGEPLWRERLAAIGDVATRERLASQLATFLRSLHSVPLRALPGSLPLACGLEGADWRTGWRRLYDRIRELVLPRLDARTRGQFAAHFDAFLDNDTNFAFPPTLIHGDFGTGNVLFDPAREEIAGILDFDSAGLGDPACDLAALMTYGEDFARAGFAAYPELASLLPRAAFYRGTFAIQEALYGVEHGDEGAFAHGIAPYVNNE
jgi:aminoglycoside 2''-phosphotransferase